MTIRVLVNGAFGRMGQLTSQTLATHAQFTLVGQTGHTHHLATAIKDSTAEVVIDFTHPDAVFENTKTIIESGAHPVIGTSGLTKAQIKTLQALCAEKKRGGIIAPNFSLGAVLMIKYGSLIAQYMPRAEIIEMHHDNKIDSPSGTAIHTAERLKQSCPTLNQCLPDTLETLPHARGALAQQVPIHAIRLPGILAMQQIIFGHPGETLTLLHQSIDRQCFMPGVLLATEKVLSLTQLIYGLETLLT